MNTTHFVYRYRWKLSTALITAAALLVVLPATAQQQMRKAERQLAEHMNHHEMVKADFRATPSFAESLAAQPTMASNPRKAAPPRRATDYTGGVYDMVDASVTVCDGTTTNQYVPMYCQNMNTSYSLESQMIYPAAMIGLPKGSKIKSISFYVGANNYSTENQNLARLRTTNPNVKVSVGETSAMTIASIAAVTQNAANMTNVFTGNVPNSSTTVTFNFSEPYEYQGGNLIVDVSRNAQSSSSQSVLWYGVSANSGSSFRYYRNSNNSSAQSFLPKMTIAYTTKGHVTYDKPFFDGISYEWIDSNERTHTSNLGDIATEPEQMIAMMREVYTNKDIPGNFKRGFTDTGGNEPYNDVITVPLKTERVL